MWFNATYNNTVKTQTGKIFFNIIETHFSQNNKLSNIINENSYGCRNHMEKLMKNSINILNKDYENNNRNQRNNTKNNKSNCPLNKCLTYNVIYKPTVTSNINTDEKAYIGATGTTFKQRFNNHKTFKKRKIQKHYNTLKIHMETKRG